MGTCMVNGEVKRKRIKRAWVFSRLIFWSFGHLVVWSPTIFFFVAEGYIEEGSQPIES